MQGAKKGESAWCRNRISRKNRTSKTIDDIKRNGARLNIIGYRAWIIKGKNDIRPIIVISKKTGNAVKRNRLRRIIKEAIKIITRQSCIKSLIIPDTTIKSETFSRFKEKFEKAINRSGLI